jgi:hypothetical protein
MGENLNPVRYPINLFRDDEMKTVIREFRLRLLQQALKTTGMPDLLKLSNYKGPSLNPDSIQTQDFEGIFHSLIKPYPRLNLIPLKEIYEHDHLPAPEISVPKVPIPKVLQSSTSKGKPAKKQLSTKGKAVGKSALTKVVAMYSPSTKEP